MKTLTHLPIVSSMETNLPKSQIFTAGVTNKEEDKLLYFVGLEKGFLPMKYLGVSLKPRKLDIAGLTVLTSKLYQRLDHRTQGC